MMYLARGDADRRYESHAVWEIKLRSRLAHSTWRKNGAAFARFQERDGNESRWKAPFATAHLVPLIENTRNVVRASESDVSLYVAASRTNERATRRRANRRCCNWLSREKIIKRSLGLVERRNLILQCEVKGTQPRRPCAPWKLSGFLQTTFSSVRNINGEQMAMFQEETPFYHKFYEFFCELPCHFSLKAFKYVWHNMSQVFCKVFFRHFIKRHKVAKLHQNS